MGSCNDCYAFAALAGLAECSHHGLEGGNHDHNHDDDDIDHEEGARVRDNFLV